MADKARKKARKKAGRSTAKSKAAGKRGAGQMPAGKMTEPPRGAKARAMPTGKMR